MSNDPTYYSIRVDYLKEWKRWIDEAINPKVTFHDDPYEMLKRAYDMRGTTLNYLREELQKRIKD